MRTILTAMADTRPAPWNVVLVVGAGSGAQLPLFRRLEAKRLLLAESNPEQRELLGRVVDAGMGEELLDVAVAVTDEPEVTLHLFSIPTYSSWRQPAKLIEILPNLRATGKVLVTTKALTTLVAEHGIEGHHRNLLVLDAPGQLDLLRDSFGLAAFSDIVVKSGQETLYDDDLVGSELASSLAELGFDCVGMDPEVVYPLEVRAFRRNDARVEVAQLRAELASAQQSTNVVATLEKQLADMRKLVAAEQARAAELTRNAESLKEENSRLHAELTSAQQRAETVTTLGAELAEARERIAAERSRISELERQADTLDKEKNKLAGELSARSAEGAKSAKETEALQKQLEHLKQRLNHLDEQLLNARDAMALAVRLQTLRENDLEDLRKRYAELYGAHQSQRALLSKLSSRLVAANEYFQKLANTGMLALDDEGIDEPPVPSKNVRKRTIAGRPGKRR